MENTGNSEIVGKTFYGEVFQSDFIEVTYRDCCFISCEFVNLNIEESEFFGCTISYSRFTNCNIDESIFTESTIYDTYFEKCTLNNVQFIKCNIRFTTFVSSYLIANNALDSNLRTITFKDSFIYYFYSEFEPLDYHFVNTYTIGLSWENKVEILGLEYPVRIEPNSMKVGCFEAPTEYFETGGTREAAAAEGLKAARFWKRYGDSLLKLSKEIKWIK